MTATTTSLRRRVPAATASEAAYLLGKARKNVYRGGAPVQLHPCPCWCGFQSGYNQMLLHLPRCPLNKPPAGSPDDFYHQQDWEVEWRKLGTFPCPVGCGQHFPYPKMLRHIPKCTSQSELEPYTVAKWVKTVADQKLWPETHLKCPLCQHYAGSYQEVLGHIPACPQQNPEAIYSQYDWLQNLLHATRVRRRRKKE